MRDVSLSELVPQYSKEDLLNIVEYNRAFTCNNCREEARANDRLCEECPFRSLEATLEKYSREVAEWINS